MSAGAAVQPGPLPDTQPLSQGQSQGSGLPPTQPVSQVPATQSQSQGQPEVAWAPGGGAAAQLPEWDNASVLWGHASLPGDRYGRLNQDYVLTQPLHDAKLLRQRGWQQCYATLVLDGHGMLGEAAARAAGDAMLGALRGAAELRRRPLGELPRAEAEALLRAVFAAGHEAALACYDSAPTTYSFPLGHRYEQRYTLERVGSCGDKVYTSPNIGCRTLEFGTTATLSLVQGRACVVADVGDSLTVLGRVEGACPADERYEGDIVSVRHFGWEEGERARLQRQCGDRVSIAEEDGYLTVEVGRLRGFQLAMTRALGHRQLAEFGVDATPSVTYHTLGPQHQALITATDGVWEILSPAEAVKLVCDCVAEGGSAGEAAAELCREAVRLASSKRHSEGAADNTTASVFVFCEL